MVSGGTSCFTWLRLSKPSPWINEAQFRGNHQVFKSMHE